MKLDISVLRIQNWRVTLMAALIGLLIVMMVVMKWLVELQVEKAQEKGLLEAATREAEARCFELTSRRAAEACRAANVIRTNLEK
jgi:hypothetical protein